MKNWVKNMIEMIKNIKPVYVYSLSEICSRNLCIPYKSSLETSTLQNALQITERFDSLQNH